MLRVFRFDSSVGLKFKIVSVGPKKSLGGCGSFFVAFFDALSLVRTIFEKFFSIQKESKKHHVLDAKRGNMEIL